MLDNNRLEVYDLTYNRLCILNDNTENSAKNIEEDLKVNSVNKVSFILPLGSDKWQYVINENLVKWKNEYYFIKVPSFTHDDSTKEVSVECHHLSSGLEGIMNPEFQLIGKTAQELMTEVLGFENIGWTVGTVNVPTDKFRSLVVKEQSIFTNLVKIAELFDAQLTFNSQARTVDLSDQSENRNIQIRKGKNLQSVNVEYDTTEMATRLYAFGGDDPVSGLQINIMDIEPNNHSYVENYSYYLAQGYTQAYIDIHPELFRHETTWEASDYLDAQMLYDDAVTKLNTLCKPKVKCNVTGLDLSIFPEYFIDSPILGETIYILDEDLQLVIDAKVTEIKRQSDKPLGLQITISNEIEYNSIVKQMVDSSQTITKVVNTAGEIRGQFIKELTVTDAHIANLDASKIKSGDIVSDRIQVAVLDAINARINSLTADDAVIKTLGANVINTINANITTAKIDSAQITALTVDDLKANVIEALYSSIENLTATDAKVKQLGADLITSVNANITTAKINSAQVGTLSANNFTAGLITSDMIKSGDITVDKLISNGAGLRFTGFVDINKYTNGVITNGVFYIGGFNKVSGEKIYDSVTTLTMTISGVDYSFTSGAVTTDNTNKKSYMLMFTTDNARFTSITSVAGRCSNIFAVYRIGTQWYADDGNVGADGTGGVAFTFNPSTDFIVGAFLINSSGIIYNWSPYVNAQTLMTGDYFKTGTVDADVLKAGSISATSGLFDTATIFDETAIRISAKAITTGTLDCQNLTVLNLRADSITAGALTIDGNNLIHGSDFANLSKWTVYNSSDYITIDTTVKFDNSNTLKFNVSGLSADAIRGYQSEILTIGGGSAFVASIYTMSDDITIIDSYKGNFYIDFLDSNDVRVGTSTLCNLVPDTNNVWKRFIVYGTAPATAVKMYLRLYLYRNGRLWLARPMLQRGSIASEWKLHTDEQITNGAIDNNKIAQNTINGDRLIENAITTRELSSLAVKTKVLEADTISAVSANISNLTVDQFQGGTIDAKKIIVGDVGKNIYEYVSYVSKAQTVNNSTDTLFHYDTNLCSTNGLNPSNGYIATIHENEGKFDGAVGVYENTTNLAPSQNLLVYSGSVFTVVDYPTLGVGWKKVNVTLSSSNANGYICNLPTMSVPNGSSYAYSVEFISETGNIVPRNDGSVSIGDMQKIGKYRYYKQYSNSTGIAKTMGIYFKYVPATISTAINETFYYRYYQVESKGFPTAYTASTRAYGVLSYGEPSQILSKTQHSVFMWVNTNQNYNNGYWNMCFSLSQAFFIGWNNGKYYVSLVDTNGIQKSFGVDMPSMVANQWYFVGYTFDNGTLKMYVDGVQVGSTQTITNTVWYGRNAGEIASANLRIGSYYNNAYSFNGLIDEVLISKNVLSDAEILAMYNLQQPLYDPDPIVKPPTPSTVTMTIQ